MKRSRRATRRSHFTRAIELLEPRQLLASEFLGDLNTGPLPAAARDFTNVGDLTFFVADDGVHGQELFVTDRTAAGTRLVRDLVPGPDPSHPISPTPFNGDLYFIALDEDQAPRLYRTDGTARGTVMVSPDVEVTVQHKPALLEYSGPLAASGDFIYFYGRSDAHGHELFRTDGTPHGTSVIKELTPGPNTVTAEQLQAMNLYDYNGRLVFTTPDAYWITDGTEAGTMKLTAATLGGYSPGTPHFAVVGDTLFFTANAPRPDGLYGPTPYGWELWKTNGTPQGTAMVKDIYPDSANSRPRNLTPLNGKLFFYADSDRLAYEPWISDGTAEGTMLVRNISPTGPSAGHYGHLPADPDLPLATWDGVVYFGANDHTHGAELWRSDGTESGTFMLADINPTVGPFSGNDSNPTNLAFVGDTLYFSAATEGQGTRLWQSDLTPQGTIPVTSLPPNFADEYPGGFALTPRGQQALSNLNTATRGSYPTQAVRLDDGTVLFVADSALYRTDGTPAGTRRVASPDLSQYAWVSRLVSAGDVAYFAGVGADGFPGYGLWKTDGTVEGTTLVTPFPYDDPHDPAEILSIVPSDTDNTVFMKVRMVGGGFQLWATDGTRAGSRLIKQINQRFDPYWAPPTYPEIAFQGRLYFTHEDPETGAELWVTDGTPHGTSLVRDLQPGPDGVGAISFFIHNDGLYFQGAGINSPEMTTLYTTDGTSAGTQPAPFGGWGTEPFRYADAGDVFYAAARRSPYDSYYQLSRVDPAVNASTTVLDFVATPHMAFFNGKLYFTNFDNAHGNELWVSDGSAGNTRLLKDVYPGDLGSMNDTRLQYPYDSYTPQFTIAGGRLYFVARDADHGRHLFSTDGTPAGTRPAAVTRQRATGVAGSDPVILLSTGDDLYFASDHQQYGYELFHLHPDQVRPTIRYARHRLDTPIPSISIAFSEDVSHSLQTFDFSLAREIEAGLEEYPSGLFTLTYDRATHTLTLGLRGRLADGQYVLRISDGSAISDASFNPLAPREILRFFHLAGDANGDGVVNISDYFAIAAGRARRLSGYSNGDFDYSGGPANADDFAIIDRAFLSQSARQLGNGNLAAATPQPLPITPVAPADLFGDDPAAGDVPVWDHPAGATD